MKNGNEIIGVLEEKASPGIFVGWKTAYVWVIAVSVPTLLFWVGAIWLILKRYF